MVTGVAALRSRFKAIPEAIKREMVIVLERYAERIVADMRRLVPVRSEALRNSIGWTWGDAPKGSLRIGTFKGKEFGALKITIYAGTRDKKLGKRDAFYALFQEFGTKEAAANPYFFPSLRANKRALRSAQTRAFRKVIKAS